MGRPIVDLTGKRFGYLTVLRLDEDRSTKNYKYWICECDCGNVKSIQGSHLKSGSVSSCGCHRYDKLYINNANRVIKIKKGTRFGHWTVIDEDKSLSKEKGKLYLICKCDCGTIKSVKKDSLVEGKSSSCGCIKSKGEELISHILRAIGVKFEQQKTFDGCVNKIPLRFDFYIPSLNMCIEYNGSQHYTSGFG